MAKTGSQPRFFVLATLFAFLAAVYHAVALIGTCFGVAASSPQRHALFIGINLALALGVWYRPRWFVWLFALLCAQQFYSHGRRAIDWASAGRVDWISLLVLVALPIAFFMLLRDSRGNRHPASGTLERPKAGG
jgi:hypothetical protein